MKKLIEFVNRHESFSIRRVPSNTPSMGLTEFFVDNGKKVIKLAAVRDDGAVQTFKYCHTVRRSEVSELFKMLAVY